MTPTDPANPNGPARGPSFSVVAPAIGVGLFLAILASAQCDDSTQGVTDSPSATDSTRSIERDPESGTR